MQYETIWNAFFEKLDPEIEFDQKLKEYLLALNYVSEIKADCLDNNTVREDINEKLRIIVEFIEQYKEHNYEIGQIKGFRTNDMGMISGRDYYYYIADQKMKASVYSARYLNFIKVYLSANSEAESELLKCIDEVKEQISNKEIDISRENVIGVIDDYLILTEEYQTLREKCIECVERTKISKDINYLKYMMFNNTMREIQYIGAAYRYLWHWECKTKNLFRYVSYDGEEMQLGDNCTKESFLQNMFNTVISHMNRSSGKLCSYSEDPYVDIYKYLKIMKAENYVFTDINAKQEGFKIKIKGLDNDNVARFDILKGVKVNPISRDGTVCDFYGFVQDGKALRKEEKLAYAVELYPELPEAEKNSKETTKNIKKLLVSYLKTWGDKTDAKNLMSYVADDKEVVTYGKIENAVVNVSGDFTGGQEAYCRYTMKFDKEELIYLLLKLRKADIAGIVKRFSVTLGWNLRNSIYDAYRESNQKIICGDACVIIDGKSMDMKVEVPSEIMMNEGKKVAVDECINRIKRILEKEVRDYFMERYNNLLLQKHGIADFVLRFIASEGYVCPSYIAEYNEYEPDKGDKEIMILKSLLFK